LDICLTIIVKVIVYITVVVLLLLLLLSLLLLQTIWCSSSRYFSLKTVLHWS